MSDSNVTTLNDWASPEVIEQENPSLNATKLRYLSKHRARLGFSDCVRFLGARQMVISRSRLASWIDTQDHGGKVGAL